MALLGTATTPFVDASLQPFEDALQLRRQTPSPHQESPQREPLSPTSGLSTKELQALYIQQSNAFPVSTFSYESRTSSFDGPQSSTDEAELQPPNAFVNERPLEAARRHSASSDKFNIHKLPKKTIGPTADSVFGLDIRDPFGWSFEDGTPYDVLLPTPIVTASPRAVYLSDPRRSSTPSLSSSPAASSAATSTVSSIVTPTAPGASYVVDYGMAKRRVSSMNDVPTLANIPSPQPIAVGKSRMNNELQYDSSPDTINGKRPLMSIFARQPKSPKPEISSKAGSHANEKPPPARRASPDTDGRLTFGGRSRAASYLSRMSKGSKSSTPSPVDADMPTLPAPSKMGTTKDKMESIPRSRLLPKFSNFSKGGRTAQTTESLHAPANVLLPAGLTQTSSKSSASSEEARRHPRDQLRTRASHPNLTVVTSTLLPGSLPGLKGYPNSSTSSLSSARSAPIPGLNKAMPLTPSDERLPNLQKTTSSKSKAASQRSQSVPR